MSKKVRPYPIEGVLEANALKKNVALGFLTVAGFIATLKGQFVHVGEHYSVIFELPVLKQSVNTRVRVLKTYDKVINPRKHIVERIAEFQFEKLTKEHKAHIVAFIAAIGQK